MFYLGIDGGTSGCRVMVIDGEKNIVTAAKRDLSTEDSEIDAKLWWQGVEHCLDDIFQTLPGHLISGISVDGTSGSLLLVDPQGSPISPALLYNDQQAKEEVEYVGQRAPKDTAVHGGGSALAKLLYLYKNYSPQGMSKVVTHSDWIMAHLGAPLGLSDWNNCLKLGFDPFKLSWPMWLNDFPFPLMSLPRVVGPGTPIGRISPSVHQRWGLPLKCTLYAGTTDSMAAFVATGAQKGDGVTSLGTTLAIKLISSTPIFNVEYGIYSHRLDKLWLAGGASNSGGGVLQQYFNDEELKALSAKINVQTESKLDYYPLSQTGERFPISDANLAAKVSPRPDQDHVFLQGLLEGMANIEALGYARLEELGAEKPQRILTVGGGAQNETWRQIRQKKLGLNIETAQHQEAAYGAALIAWSGAHGLPILS